VRDSSVTRGAGLSGAGEGAARFGTHAQRTDQRGRILGSDAEAHGSGRELPIEVIRAQLTTARIEQHIAQLETATIPFRASFAT